MKTSCIILAGGAGKRMKSERPKVLAEVLCKPMLGWVLDSAEKMCDAFVILHKGEVRAQGNLQQLRDAFAMPEASLNDIYLALTKEEEL